MLRLCASSVIFGSFWTSTLLKPSEESFGRDEIMIKVARLTSTKKLQVFLPDEQSLDDLCSFCSEFDFSDPINDESVDSLENEAFCE